jgi:uncharacterized protein YbjT (DUF2867 family)
MRVVVIGGTGQIGSRLVHRLAEHGHDAVAASPSSGVNALTGEGLDEALRGADVVVDVSNSPALEDHAVMRFFTTSTANLLAAGRRAGVQHHLALSVVGSDRLPESGYFRAKVAQEALIRAAPMRSTIIRATQFFEFLGGIADSATDRDTVRLPPALLRPVAADDVASTIERVATGEHSGAVLELAGPEEARLDDFVKRVLAAARDPRRVIADPMARYFGASLGERALLPDPGALRGPTSFGTWLEAQSSASRQAAPNP